MIIVNHQTTKLIEEELKLQFKETYLDIQEVLVKFLKRAETEEEKEKIKGMIKGVGEAYKYYKDKQENCPKGLDKGVGLR